MQKKYLILVITIFSFLDPSGASGQISSQDNMSEDDLCQISDEFDPLPTVPLTISENDSNKKDGYVQKSLSETTLIRSDSAGKIKFQYFVSDYHCGDVKVHVMLDGVDQCSTTWLGNKNHTSSLPLKSGIIQLNVKPDTEHSISFYPEGRKGGCTDKYVISWFGTVQFYKDRYEIIHSGNSLFYLIITVGIIAAIAICFLWMKFNHRTKPKPEPKPESVTNFEITPDNSKNDQAIANLSWTRPLNISTNLSYQITASSNNKIDSYTTSDTHIAIPVKKGEVYEFNIVAQNSSGTSEPSQIRYFFTSSILDENQQKAVSHDYRTPLLIISGPGSGKTHVIIERVKELLVNKHVAGERILCLSFNKRIQTELKNKLSVDNDLKKLKIQYPTNNTRTYNSFGNEIANIPNIFKNDSWIAYQLSHGDYPELIKSAADQNDLKERISTYIGAFRKEKIAPQTFEEYLEKNKETLNDKQYRKYLEFLTIYKKYMEYLTNENKKDFDDQIILCQEILENNHIWGNKFDHIFVDEYQDNNYVHTLIAKSLAPNGNITVVGDQDQTINTFQGANIANFSDFKEKYRNYTLVELFTNYRSTQIIVNLANLILQKLNSSKKLYTNNPTGEKIQIVKTQRENYQYDFIMQEINELIKRGYAYNDIICICRTNKACNSIYQFLKSNEIPVSLKENSENTTNSVTVGTVHYSKGREFKIVFILGVFDGQFPISFFDDDITVPNILRHYRLSVDDKTEHDNEEMRILFVAITRAKERLYLLTVSNNETQTSLINRIESSFSNNEYLIRSFPDENNQKSYPASKIAPK